MNQYRCDKILLQKCFLHFMAIFWLKFCMISQNCPAKYCLLIDFIIIVSVHLDIFHAEVISSETLDKKQQTFVWLTVGDCYCINDCWDLTSENDVWLTKGCLFWDMALAEEDSGLVAETDSNHLTILCLKIESHLSQTLTACSCSEDNKHWSAYKLKCKY